MSLTIWVVTALLNTALGGTALWLFSQKHISWPGPHLLVFIFTLICSVPGMFVFWIVLLANWNNALLFRCLLKAGFIISALSSLLLYIFPLDEGQGQQGCLGICIVIALIGSIMIHHSIIKSFSPGKKGNRQ